MRRITERRLKFSLPEIAYQVGREIAYHVRKGGLVSRSPKAALKLLIVHCEDAHILAEAAHAQRHEIQTVADYEEAASQLGSQRFDILIAPLNGDPSDLSAAAGRYGVALWLVAQVDQLERLEQDLGGVDDFLQSPVLGRVFRQRLRLYQERCEFRARQTQLENLLRENASIDPLTHLPNRHFAMQNLQLQWQRYRRKFVPFSAILCDLDDFKKTISGHGQRFGDRLLRSVADLFQGKLRASDLICRYDGQEFVILCSDTELPGALQLAERLRLSLTRLEVKPGVSISACFAVVQSHERFRSPDQLLTAAEELLEQAKSRGPNQVSAMPLSGPEMTPE